MKNNKQSLGERIKELREQKGMTQQQLADLLFVSNKTISKWEKNDNEPDSEMLVKLSEIFNITLDYLLKGDTSLKETEAISKMELACREDNIALLAGLDLDAFDSSGKDVDYYAKQFNAKNVLSYLEQIRLNQKIDRYEKIHKNDESLFYVCALEEGITGEDNLVLVLRNVKREEVPVKCSELEKKGYHGFSVFSCHKDKEVDYCDLDYSGLSMSVLNNGGKRELFIIWTILNDDESAVVTLSFYNSCQEGKEPEKMNLFARKEVMKQLIELLNDVDFRNWKNKNWGMPICHVNYLLQGPLTTNECTPGFFYSNPGVETYRKFVKGLAKFFFDIMKPWQYRKFVLYFNDTCDPYYRLGMKFEESKKLFSEIENERSAPGRIFEQ